jgi:hypothetical protein
MQSAKEVVFAHCSDQPCLLYAFNCNASEAMERVKTLRQQIAGNHLGYQTTQSKANDLLELLKHNLKQRRRPSGQLAWMVDISLNDDKDLKLVCKSCFCNIHGISPRTFDTLVQEVKRGVISHTNDAAAVANMYTRNCRDQIVDLMITTGQPVPTNRVLVIAIPDTVAAS